MCENELIKNEMCMVFYCRSSILCEWAVYIYIAWNCNLSWYMSHSLPDHQLQDISEAASLLRRVRMGDQPNSDWASSAWWRRPKRYPCLEPCFPAQTRGLGFIWKQMKQKLVKRQMQQTLLYVFLHFSDWRGQGLLQYMEIRHFLVTFVHLWPSACIKI